MITLTEQQLAEALGLAPRADGSVAFSGVSTDSRAVAAGALFVAIAGPRFDGHDYVEAALRGGAAGAVVSKAVPLPDDLAGRPLFAVPDTVAAMGRLARWWRRRWGRRVVAVTGSNGKTTTREMLAHFLGGRWRVARSPKSFNNAIGLPLTLFGVGPEHDMAVVEIGTNAPGEIAALAAIAEPDDGVITNIGESHLEGLGSLEGVAKEKGALFAALAADGTAFLNADDPWSGVLAKRCKCRVVAFGRAPDADLRCVEEERQAGGTRFRLAEGREFFLPVPGAHNVSNALAALAVCRELGALDAAAERMATFRMPDLRFQIERVGGATLVADCYNANPASMRAALDEMDALPCAGRRMMVCGDMLELGGREEAAHRELGERIARSRLDALFAVGPRAALAAEEANRIRPTETHCFGTAEEAAPFVAQSIRPADALLVKGSNSMRLGIVVGEVKKELQAGAEMKV